MIMHKIKYEKLSVSKSLWRFFFLSFSYQLCELSIATIMIIIIIRETEALSVCINKLMYEREINKRLRNNCVIMNELEDEDC